MSTVNYSLKHKGVRLITAEEAWVSGKNGRRKLNPDYYFIGKLDTKLPNLITTASDNRKPKYKGNTYDLNNKAKDQIVSHFYDNNGKRNRRSVAYFGIKKTKKSK